MPVPSLHGNFHYGEKHAHRRKETFGALPVLLVALHAAFQIGQASAITVAHQAAHLRFQHAQIADHLGFEFIHHAHVPHSVLRLIVDSIHPLSGKLMNNAVENSE